MEHDYKSHDWRADDFGMIRGAYGASVTRAWCAETTCSDPWSFNVFRADGDDCSSLVPDDVKHYGFTFAGAVAAAEAFMAELEANDKRGNVWAFEGAPMPAEECF